MTELVKPDLVTQGMGLLPSFWDDKVKARGLLKSFLQSFQNPLDLIFEILNGTSLFDAEGVQLDIIGKYWGVKRGIAGDFEYRNSIFNAISRQVADGTPEKIVEITKTYLGNSSVELFEHFPGNVHVRYNAGVNSNLKTLGELITSAGVSYNARFEPIFDSAIYSSRPPVFDYSGYTLLNGATWIESNITVTQNVAVAPDGTNTMFSLQDSSTTANAFTYTTFPNFSATKKYFCAVWIKKDAAATWNAMIRLTFSGSASGNEYYDVEVKVSNGTFNTNVSSKKYRVLDLGNYFLVTIEKQPVYADQTTGVLYLYPALSTTFGTYAATTTGTTIMWNPMAGEVDENKYPSAYPLYNTFKCAERISKEYIVIDEAANNIITEGVDQVIAEVITKTRINSRPLAEFGNITQEQALTEVI